MGAVLVSVLTWAILDFFQNRQLKEIFSADLSKKLDDQAFQDRLRFDQTLKGIATNIDLIAEHPMVRQHVLGLKLEQGNWDQDETVMVPIVDGKPGWVPRLPKTVDAVLILDHAKRIREIWRTRMIDLPNRIMAPTEHLLQRSHDQPYLIQDNEKLYLTTNTEVQNSTGQPFAYIMYVSQIDSLFMLKIRGFLNHGDSITSFISGISAKVLVSNDPVRIPESTPLEALEADYLIIGKSFLDYGNSELKAGLATLMPKTSFSRLIEPVTKIGRQQRALTAAIISAAFVLLMLALVRAIRGLSERVNGFTERYFDTLPQQSGERDEIARLNSNFERLTQEVLGSRKALQNEAIRLGLEIDEHKKTEQKLLREKAISETANRSKSDFMSNMSHELRTPLNAIIGFSDAMRQEIFGPISPEKYKSYPNDIYESGMHLMDLINDVLDIAKIEAGKLELYEEEVSITRIMESVRRMICGKADEKKVDLAVKVEGGLPPLRADERKLKQILLNITSNAVKFTPSGGTVYLSAGRKKDGNLELIVKDTGIGISKEDIARVFQPFFQVDSKITRAYEGTGLGLAITEGLVEVHGGSMTIDSKEGEGTSVIITLPAERQVVGSPQDKISIKRQEG